MWVRSSLATRYNLRQELTNQRKMVISPNQLINILSYCINFTSLHQASRSYGILSTHEQVHEATWRCPPRRLPTYIQTWYVFYAECNWNTERSPLQVICRRTSNGKTIWSLVQKTGVSWCHRKRSKLCTSLNCPNCLQISIERVWHPPKFNVFFSYLTKEVQSSGSRLLRNTVLRE